MAADDWLAILLLLGRPDVDVRAITVTGTGEAHCAPGVRNARALVELAGKPPIPVACDRETPLAGGHAFPDDWRSGVDDLFGIDIPDGPTATGTMTAVEVLKKTIGATPGEVTLLTLGPLTNIAEALAAEPTLADAVKSIVIMGGAVHVPGNVGPSIGIDNRVAEWNVYADPLAARQVLESRLAITLVPLDATNHAPVTPSFEQQLAASATTPRAKFARDVLSRLHDSIASGGYYFWDPLAAAIVVDEGLTTFEEGRLTVETADGLTSGGMVAASGGQVVRVAVSADRERFEALLLASLNG